MIKEELEEEAQRLEEMIWCMQDKLYKIYAELDKK